MNARTTTSRRGVSFWSVLFGLVVIGWLGFFFLNPTHLNKVGVSHLRIVMGPEKFHDLWFIDTFAILAANDAVAAGEDPYKPNALDYLKRPHVYGPSWLYLRHFGLTRDDSVLLGFLLLTAFVATAVVFLRPQTAGGFVWSFGIFCTTPILLGLERANNDLFVFLLLALLIPSLLSGNVVVRWLSVPLLLFAVALKYYPLLACVMLLTPASMAETRWRILVVGVGVVLVGWSVMASVPRIDVIPAPVGMFTFGAAAPLRAWGMTGWAPQAIVGVVAFAAFALWWHSPVLTTWDIGRALRRQWMYFVMGGALLAGCFFAGQNYAYRWVFAIWLAPFLWTLLQSKDVAPAVLNIARLTAALLIVALWAEPIFILAIHRLPEEEVIRAANGMTWVMQPIIWAFMICLLGFLAKFTRDAWTRMRQSQRVTPGPEILAPESPL